MKYELCLNLRSKIFSQISQRIAASKGGACGSGTKDLVNYQGQFCYLNVDMRKKLTLSDGSSE